VREVREDQVLYPTSQVKLRVTPLEVVVVQLLVQLEPAEVHVHPAKSQQPSRLLRVQVLTLRILAR
jgi:hypothetical protein